MKFHRLLLAVFAGAIGAGMAALAPTMVVHATVTALVFVPCERVLSLAPDACKGTGSLPPAQISKLADDLWDKDGKLTPTDLTEVRVNPAVLDQSDTDADHSLLMFAFVSLSEPMTFTASDKLAFVVSETNTWPCGGADEDCGGEFGDGVVTANLVNVSAVAGDAGLSVSAPGGSAPITISGIGPPPAGATDTTTTLRPRLRPERRLSHPVEPRRQCEPPPRRLRIR